MTKPLRRPIAKQTCPIPQWLPSANDAKKMEVTLDITDYDRQRTLAPLSAR